MKSAKRTLTILDLLRKTNRGPQVVLPKDAAAMIGITGVSSGWHCLDAGAGSAWLCGFVGNLIQPKGKLTSYERDERWYKVAKENIKMFGLEKIVKVKRGDVRQAPELKKADHLDLITLDVKEPEDVVPKAAHSLKPGGFIAIFSPHIEQQRRAIDAIRKSGSFTFVNTIETIQRPWQVSDFTHPEISGLLHTCFLTVARKRY